MQRRCAVNICGRKEGKNAASKGERKVGEKKERKGKETREEGGGGGVFHLLKLSSVPEGEGVAHTTHHHPTTGRVRGCLQIAWSRTCGEEQKGGRCGQAGAGAERWAVWAGRGKSGKAGGVGRQGQDSDRAWLPA